MFLRYLKTMNSGIFNLSKMPSQRHVEDIERSEVSSSTYIINALRKDVILNDY